MLPKGRPENIILSDDDIPGFLLLVYMFTSEVVGLLPPCPSPSLPISFLFLPTPPLNHFISIPTPPYLSLPLSNPPYTHSYPFLTLFTLPIPTYAGTDAVGTKYNAVEFHRRLDEEYKE